MQMLISLLRAGSLLISQNQRVHLVTTSVTMLGNITFQSFKLSMFGNERMPSGPLQWWGVRLRKTRCLAGLFMKSPVLLFQPYFQEYPVSMLLTQPVFIHFFWLLVASVICRGRIHLGRPSYLPRLHLYSDRGSFLWRSTCLSSIRRMTLASMLKTYNNFSAISCNEWTGEGIVIFIQRQPLILSIILATALTTDQS